jgi:hypothetical protein
LAIALPKLKQKRPKKWGKPLFVLFYVFFMKLCTEKIILSSAYFFLNYQLTKAIIFQN